MSDESCGDFHPNCFQLEGFADEEDSNKKASAAGVLESERITGRDIRFSAGKE